MPVSRVALESSIVDLHERGRAVNTVARGASACLRVQWSAERRWFVRSGDRRLIRRDRDCMTVEEWIRVHLRSQPGERIQQPAKQHQIKHNEAGHRSEKGASRSIK